MECVGMDPNPAIMLVPIEYTTMVLSDINPEVSHMKSCQMEPEYNKKIESSLYVTSDNKRDAISH